MPDGTTHTVPGRLVLHFLFLVPSPVPSDDIFSPFHSVLYLINRVTLPSIHLLFIPSPLTLKYNIFLFNKDKKRAFVDSKKLLHCAVEGQLLYHLQANLARCVRPLFFGGTWSTGLSWLFALLVMKQQALVLLHFSPLAMFNYMGGITKN